MKNLKYFAAALVLAFSLGGCSVDIPPEDASLPTVDIVQRSELLDMVTIDYILTPHTQKLLADKGVSVSMSDFDLTADDMARFKLNFDTEHGSYSYKFNAALDYTKLANGKFENIRLYWGSVQAVDGGLLLTSLYDYAFLPLDKKADNFTPHYLSFIKDAGGYIVHSAYGFDRYAFIYRTDSTEGIAVFDTDGKMLSKYVTENKGDKSDVPFSYKNRLDGQFVNENLFLERIAGQSISDFRLYNVAENTMSGSLTFLGQNLTDGDKTYSFCEIYMPSDYYKVLALRQEDGRYTGAVLSDTKGYLYSKQVEGEKSVTSDGKLIFKGQPSGLRFTVDFENNICEKDYSITEDMLDEKIATSKDKSYSLYEYSKHSYNSRWKSYLAVKNEKSGDISFISDFKGTAKTENVLEAGFFSNGDIYMLTDYDFEIYTAETVESGPIFNIGEKFPLGVKKEDGYRYNNLHAVRRDPADGSFIVVFDHLNENRFYDGPVDSKDSSLFDDKYEVSLLDSRGNIVKTYMTQMSVPAGSYPLNIYMTGDTLTLQNVDSETGKILQKATLNITTGKFKQLQEWKSPV